MSAASRDDPRPAVVPAATDDAPAKGRPATDAAATGKSRAVRRANIVRSIRAGAPAGNGNATKHAVYSIVGLRADIADEIAFLLARAPWLDPVRDGPAIEQCARLVVRLRKLDLAVEAITIDWATRAEPRPGTQSLTALAGRLEQSLTRALDALGLTPTASARLGITKMIGAEKARRATEEMLAKYRPAPAGSPETADPPVRALPGPDAP